MRILLAPDKFKQTLTQQEAADAMAEGVASVFPEAEMLIFPMADGGEGTLSVLFPDQAQHVRVPSTGPLGAPGFATCARTSDGVGLVEMALCSGLGLIRPGRSEALLASSRGTGEAIVQLGESCIDVRIGVGGSASTDGGTGAARAAGYRFLDRLGREIPDGGRHLANLVSIDAPAPSAVRVTGLCDVMAPLTGPEGAAQRFAPQKGASDDEVLTLEEGLLNLAAVIQRDLGVYVTDVPGAGAGGGMGAGLAAFFGAELVSGAAAVADATGLDGALAGADLILTGEGRLDRGTLSNKVVAEVARRAVRSGVPVIAVCGSVDPSLDLAALGLTAAYSTEDLGGTPGTQGDAAARLSAAVTEALRDLATDQSSR